MDDYLARLGAPDDPLRRVLLAVRGWTGPPPSVVLGRKIVTSYIYDAAGRILRTETEGWVDDDLAMIMALDAGLCPGCHFPLAETLDPENEDRYKETQVLLCHRCVAREQAAEGHQDHHHPGALLSVIDLPRQQGEAS